MSHIRTLSSKNLVKVLPKLKFQNDKSHVACQKGKQVKHCFNINLFYQLKETLELIYMDLFGTSRKNYYASILIDNFLNTHFFSCIK